MKHWRIVVCLAALIGASAALGGWAGWKCTQAKPNQDRAEPWHQRAFRELSQEMRYSEEQLQLARKNADRAVQQLRELRDRTLAEERQILNGLLDELEADLTESQRKNFSRPDPKKIRLELLYVDPED